MCLKFVENQIFLQRRAGFAADHSVGAKNGKRYGKRYFIVRSDVRLIKLNQPRNHWINCKRRVSNHAERK